MVNISDFVIDGEMRWDLYTQARIDAGEICYQCSRHLTFNKNKGIKTLCSSCKALQDSKSSISHDTYIRCPKCKTSYLPDAFREYSVFEEGEHDIDCPKCGYFFIIETTISYSFESPALDDEDDFDEGEDEIGYTYEEDEFPY
jgi:DNA-directed RNA polymerase subunit RPC12/RpoP